MVLHLKYSFYAVFIKSSSLSGNFFGEKTFFLRIFLEKHLYYSLEKFKNNLLIVFQKKNSLKIFLQRSLS